jgi:UDP-N-acetylglucosamine 2-epimerase
MLKIANIVGARPQLIKYFPISKAIQSFIDSSGKNIKEILIHSGQHYDYNMSEVFFKELGIKEPGHHLGVGSGSHGEQTAKIIERSEGVLLKEKPDILIVYGDTNTTLGATIAASKLHIPVAHVEAGLRSFNRTMPEEVNRVLIDHISSLLFSPNEGAVTNLHKEGFANVVNNGNLVDLSTSISALLYPAVINVGDVMYDLQQHAVGIAEKKSTILNDLDVAPKNYILLTLHRAENADHVNNFQKIVKFVNEISDGKRVVFPMHPRTKKSYDETNVKCCENIKIIEPFSYFDALMLLKNSSMVMTDSGGMQKEAYWLKVPCITLREETEWVETVQSGWNILYKNYNGLHKPINHNACYGDGKAARRIAKIVINNIK